MIEIVENNDSYWKYAYFTLCKYMKYDIWTILGHIKYSCGAQMCRSIARSSNPSELAVWADLNGIKIRECNVE